MNMFVITISKHIRKRLRCGFRENLLVNSNNKLFNSNNKQGYTSSRGSRGSRGSFYVHFNWATAATAAAAVAAVRFYMHFMSYQDSKLVENRILTIFYLFVIIHD